VPLQYLKIRNFRNLQKLDLDFESLITYIHAPNGTGKTNILEAIQCLSIGKSLRAKTETELFSLSQEPNQPQHIYIHGNFQDQDNLEFTQTYSLERDILNDVRKRKTLLINKTKTSINTYIGRVPSIWFSPESIKIIDSSPRSKRKYFDDILIQLYPEYIFDLRNYEKSLKHRNKLLSEHQNSPNQIRIWTEQVIKYGNKIMEFRKNFFRILNEHFEKLSHIHRYRFKIDFQPNIKTDDVFLEDLEYTFRDELRKSYERDKLLCTTTVGPHKDDWYMLIDIQANETRQNFIRADSFASRGQQRMALIVLQIVLITIFQEHQDKKPILLLDDIFSELDIENEKILVDYITQENIQAFITGVFPKNFKDIKEYNLLDILI